MLDKTLNELQNLAPSKLLRLALQDLEACEVDPQYNINMGTWVDLQDDGSCSVCLAGAFLVQRIDDQLEDYGIEAIHPVPRALDLFRSGLIRNALATLGHETPVNIPEVVHEIRYSYFYDDQPDRFKVIMHDIADKLEGNGL